MLCVVPLVGCARWTLRGEPASCASPLFVPIADRDYVWDNIVDAVDDYFDIEREDRVKLVGDVLTVGRIETVPLSGATFLEPWRGDSANRVERLESTLQSIRRRAAVQVVPVQGGFLVDVMVFKELEDVLRPDYAPTAASTFANYTSVERATPPASPQPTVLGWIPQGRDPALEQRLLQDIRGRLSPPPPAFPGLARR